VLGSLHQELHLLLDLLSIQATEEEELEDLQIALILESCEVRHQGERSAAVEPRCDFFGVEADAEGVQERA
jgi:hypothetical protein